MSAPPEGLERLLYNFDQHNREIVRLREALTEIANRASNLLDDDAVEWMPSIYKIACEAIGEDPSRLLALVVSRPQRERP